MTYVPTDPKLRAIAERLPPEVWEERVATAKVEALLLAEASERVRGGATRRAALAEVIPDRPYGSTVRRLRRFEAEGLDGLIDRRAPLPPERKVTPEVRGAVRALAHACPELHSAELADALEASLGVRLCDSTMREVLREVNQARPRGRPRGGGGEEAEAEEVTPLPLAGAELLMGVEEHIGAVRALSTAIDGHLETLPALKKKARDDRADRDERGRFLGSYNDKEERSDPDLGPRFRSVEQRRVGKALGQMQVVKRSVGSRYLKDLSLTMLPVVVNSPRWSSLRHWSGQQLEELVGYAYQPSTLDKYTRELKYAGVATVARDAAARFWFGQEGPSPDADTTAVILYADGTTKPLWTRHYSRSTKVSKTGRVQPATTTLVLSSGAGTPLVYEAHSGSASLPARVRGLLARWEKAGGAGTARRMVVVDRECHAVWLLKELARDGWLFIVPVRRTSAGPTARWEEVGPWKPTGDEQQTQLRGAQLWLRDSKAPADPMQVRAVSRRRGPDDSGATWATNAPTDEFTDADILRLYGARWSNQEHVFRDANGSVGLDVHHGYGKVKVDNIAIIDRLERLEAKLERAREQMHLCRVAIREHEADVAAQMDANAVVEQWREELLVTLDSELRPHNRVTHQHREDHDALMAIHVALPKMHEALCAHQAALDEQIEGLAELQASAQRWEAEHARCSSKTQIYTVDVELDEIMTAYKLTFLNLARTLTRDYLGVDWQLDTLIRAVLTLPGERARTASTETIRIHHQPRDPAAMAAVRIACDRLNQLGLARTDGDKRRQLRFELQPPPDADGGSD